MKRSPSSDTCLVSTIALRFLRMQILAAAFLCAAIPFAASAQQPVAPTGAPAAGGDLPPATESDKLCSEAMAAFDAGDFQGTLDKLDTLFARGEIANATDPKILQILDPVFYVKGAALYNLKKYEEALVALKLYLSKYPQGKQKEDAIFSIANSFIALKKYDEALGELAKLEKIPSLREDALLLEASIYYEKKDFQAAQRPLSILTENGLTTPAAIRASVIQGSIYTQLGQFDKATKTMLDVRREFDRIDDKAQFNSTILDLGDKLFRAGLPREAQVIYQMVQTKDELRAAQKASIERKKREIPLALDAFRTTKDPSFLRKRTRLEGEVKQAETSLEQLEKIPDPMIGILIRRGRAYAEFGRQREALIIYDHILDNFPDDKEERDVAAFSRILAFVDLQKVKEAIGAAESYLEKFPQGRQRETATYLRGALALDNNDPRAAVTYFGTSLSQADDAMKKSELYPKMIFLLGVANFSLSDFPAAAKQFADYISQFPQGDFVQESEYRTALCALFADKEIGYKKAVGLFESYLKKYPSGEFATDAKYRIAVCDMTAASSSMVPGEFEKVVNDCDAWLAEFPGERMTGEILALKGDALVQLKKTKEAADCYQASAEATASDEVLMYSIMAAAKQYQDLGDWETMNTMFRSFLEKHPDHPGAVAAYYYIAQAMIKQKKTQEAKAFLADKIRDNISDPRKEAVERLLLQLAQLCVKKPRMPDEATPASPAATSGNATAAAPATTPRPKPDPSIEFEEILATFPDTPAAKARKLYARSELENMRRKPEAGAEYLDRLADSAQPEDLSPMLLGKVGDTLFLRGQDAKSREMYQQIIGSFSNSEYADYAYVGLGDLAMRAGNYDEALKNYTIAADELEMSKLKEATVGKAKALFALQKYPEAAKIFETVTGIKEWRGEATAESLYYLGRIAQENKDFAKAIAFYQRIFLTQQKYPKLVAKAYMGSAMCFKELGKTTEAKNTYAEMLRNEKLKAAKVPELDEARKQIDQL
jgi:tetratricopeptide (TPR) repeat protein